MAVSIGIGGLAAAAGASTAVIVGAGVVGAGLASQQRKAQRAQTEAAVNANRESIAAGERQTASLIEASKPSAAELQLQQQNLEISRAQLEAINRQSDLQASSFQSQLGLQEQQLGLQRQGFALQGDVLGLQREGLGIQREGLNLQREGFGLQQESFDFTRQLIADAQEEQERINAILPPELKAQLERQQLEFALELGPVQQEISKLQLERIKQGDRATPEQEALINKVTAGAKATGESDIDRATSMALEQLRDDFANASGLRPSDSPILDRAGRIQAEAIRSKGQLSAQLESGAANAKLNFPLMATSVLSGAAGVQQQFGSQVQQFQQQLREQAFTNRMAIAGQFQNNGLGLTSQLPNAGLNLLNQLQGNSLAFSGLQQSGGFSLANVGGGPLQAQQVAGQRGLGILGMRTNFPNLNVPQVSGMNLGQIGQLAQGLGSAFLAFSG